MRCSAPRRQVPNVVGRHHWIHLDAAVATRLCDLGPPYTRRRTRFVVSAAIQTVSAFWVLLRSFVTAYGITSFSTMFTCLLRAPRRAIISVGNYNALSYRPIPPLCFSFVRSLRARRYRQGCYRYTSFSSPPRYTLRFATCCGAACLERPYTFGPRISRLVPAIALCAVGDAHHIIFCSHHFDTS